MNTLKYLDRDKQRNITEVKLDTSGRFRLIDYYDEAGNCHSRLYRVESPRRRGRPKGIRNAATLLQEVFNAPVPVRQGEKKRYLSRAEAMLRNVVAKGLNGEVRALSFLLDLLEMTGWFDESSEENQKRAPLITHAPLDIEDWKVLADRHWEKQQQRNWAWQDAQREGKRSEGQTGCDSKAA